jgi:non-ribosomal peptide synthetase component E (peptide arylation enzyme)
MPPRTVIDGVRYRSAEEARPYIESGAWLDATAGSALRATAREAPEKPAVIATDATLSFSDLDKKSESAAASLIEAGLRPGDRAIFQIGSVSEIFVAMFACFKAGVVPLCTLPQYREIEIGELGRRAAAKAFFVQADVHDSFDQLNFARTISRQIPSLEKIIVVRGVAGAGELSLQEMVTRHDSAAARSIVRPHDPSAEDVIMFQLSGGSTGLPKIIPRMHAEYLGHSLALAERYGYAGKDDVGLWALPLIHNAGMLFMVMPTALCGRTTVIHSRFDVEEFLSAIEQYKVTFTGSIGPVAPRILAHRDLKKFNLSSLRQFFALSRSDAIEAHVGKICGNMFGITEGLVMASAPTSSKASRHETVGHPIRHEDEVKILVPGSDDETEFGIVGELCFRGPSTLTGYYADATATRAAFNGSGFFRTGDLVRGVNIDGITHYVFEGRLKDNINRGGEKIGAEELETLIARHAGVMDCCVVAMPDPFYGEKVCAYIVARPGQSVPGVTELSQFLISAGLAKYKHPERVEAVSAFPVTRVGKVDKAALRTDVAAKLSAETGDAAPRTDAKRA